jgi:hypothetical protein
MGNLKKGFKLKREKGTSSRDSNNSFYFRTKKLKRRDRIYKQKRESREEQGMREGVVKL